MNFNGESDRGQSRPADRTTVSKSHIDAAEEIMPTGTATPRKGDVRADVRRHRQYPAPMTEQPAPTNDEQVEAIYQDPGLTREQKLAAIAALYDITEPVTAPELFAHIRGFEHHKPAET